MENLCSIYANASCRETNALYKSKHVEYAGLNWNVEVVKVLIEAGTDVNTGAIEPVLVTAVRFGHAEVVKAVIDAGADVNNGYNKQALKITAVRGYEQCMSLLIDAGADVNHVYNNDKSALILATEKCHTKCMKLLIKNGAQVNWYAEPFQHFPKHLFQRYQQTLGKLYWLLLAAGVDSRVLNTLFPKSRFIFPLEEEMSLMYLCREVTRKHLLQMSPVNLFFRVPQLGLPTLLQDYLLLNVSLDDDDDDDDTDDDQE